MKKNGSLIGKIKKRSLSFDALNAQDSKLLKKAIVLFF